MTGTFKLDRAGMKPAARRQLLTAPKVRAQLDGIAARIAHAAGQGHATDRDVGRHRARASVRTTTWHAIYRQARRKTLSQALAAGKNR
jgi:hypothetical protein